MNYSLTSPLLAILFLTLSLGFVGIAYYLAKPKQKAKSSFEEEILGRISQLSEDSAKREVLFRESLDKRLNTVSDRVGKSIQDTQERNSNSLKQLHERLALIDRA